jgi:hypothetical protein
MTGRFRESTVNRRLNRFRTSHWTQKHLGQSVENTDPPAKMSYTNE